MADLPRREYADLSADELAEAFKKALSKKDFNALEKIGEEQNRKRIQAEKEKEKAEKEKEKAEKEKEKAEKEKEKAETRLQEEGDQDFYGMDLPALNHTEKTTVTHINMAHEEASVSEHDKDFSKRYKDIHSTHPGTCQPIMRTWFLLKKDDNGQLQRFPLKYANEADLVNRIFQYLEVALGATNLNEKLQIHFEYFVYSFRPDIMLLLKKDDGRTVPIGVIEVKIPKEGVMNNTIFQGQLYDYMRILRDIFGVQDVFGIMSTFEEWRFCWLPRRSLRIQHQQPQPAEERIMLASNVFKSSEKALHKAVVYVLDRMANAEVNQIGQPTTGDYCLCLEKQRLSWRPLPAPINDNGFSASSTSFYIFGSLGSGAEGRVWRGCDANGRKCAIKVYTARLATDLPNQEKAAEKEADIWHKVFQEPQVKQLTLANSPALIMPVLDQPKEWSPNHTKAVRDAVRVYSAHYFANDLKKEHVGFIKANGHLKAILFDTQPGDPHQGGEAEMLGRLGL